MNSEEKRKIYEFKKEHCCFRSHGTVFPNYCIIQHCLRIKKIPVKVVYFGKPYVFITYEQFDAIIDWIDEKRTAIKKYGFTDTLIQT